MNPAALLVAAALLTMGTGVSENQKPIVVETRVSQPAFPQAGESSQVLVFTSRTACGSKRSHYRVRSHPVETKAVLTAALHKFFRTLHHPGLPPPRDLVNRVELVDGVARIDFADFTKPLGWASTTCGGTSFLGSLNNTVFQFDSVRAVRYSFDGSCAAFQAFMQSACVDGFGTLTRREWKRSRTSITGYRYPLRSFDR